MKDSSLKDSSDDRKKIDELFEAISSGDPEAKDKLMPLVYNELRRLAHSRLRYNRDSHTIRTTTLVHEAYINLVRNPSQDWKNRAYFFSAAGELMREILIDHMRKRQRLKRGAGAKQVDIDPDEILPDTKDKELILLDEALKKLSRAHKTLSEVVINRYFAGLTIEDTATVMNIAPATVKRKWKLAKAWLAREMGGYERHRPSKG